MKKLWMKVSVCVEAGKSGGGGGEGCNPPVRFVSEADVESPSVIGG